MNKIGYINQEINKWHYTDESKFLAIENYLQNSFLLNSHALFSKRSIWTLPAPYAIMKHFLPFWF